VARAEGCEMIQRFVAIVAGGLIVLVSVAGQCEAA
jgi:hypothetical protein